MSDDVRFVVKWDDDNTHLIETLAQWDTPETYAGNEVLKDDQPVPFDEYMRTYGNLDNYMVLRLEKQKRCSLGGWHTTDSLNGIDFYCGDPIPDTGEYTLESLPDEFKEYALEML